jgi:hypothetical protein
MVLPSHGSAVVQAWLRRLGGRIADMALHLRVGWPSGALPPLSRLDGVRCRQTQRSRGYGGGGYGGRGYGGGGFECTAYL